MRSAAGSEGNDSDNGVILVITIYSGNNRVILTVSVVVAVSVTVVTMKQCSGRRLKTMAI